MKNPLTGKNILITAGPTWVAIDRVRVITNIFSGRSGCIIARESRQMGAKVKLLLGPGRPNLPTSFFKGIKVIKYHYFDELLNIIKYELTNAHYDAVIHSAAIADYMPLRPQVNKKIPSGKNKFIIKLKPTVKIIKLLKKWDPDIFLVQFKLEIGKKKDELIRIGYQSMRKNNADLIVVNDLDKMDGYKHEAFIIDLKKNIKMVSTRNSLARNLLKIVAQNI